MIVLIDSDIVIEVTRGYNQPMISRWMSLAEEDTAILYSPVTVAEVWAGARPSEYKLLENFFRALTCAPITEETGRLAGAFLRQFRRSHNLQVADALIAAGAVAHSAKLWTRNIKHYPMKELTLFEA